MDPTMGLYVCLVKQVDESFLVDFGCCLFGCSLIFICSRYLTKTMVDGSDCVVFGCRSFRTLLFQCDLRCVRAFFSIFSLAKSCVDPERKG